MTPLVRDCLRCNDLELCLDLLCYPHPRPITLNISLTHSHDCTEIHVHPATRSMHAGSVVSRNSTALPMLFCEYFFSLLQADVWPVIKPHGYGVG